MSRDVEAVVCLAVWRDGWLRYEKLPIPDSDRQTLCIYHAPPRSRSAQALALLATTIAGEREPVRSARAA